MKTSKLSVDYDFDFVLIGITSTNKDYKLAWAINQKVDIELQREDELSMDFRDGKQAKLLYYTFKTENSLISLIRNKLFDSIDKKPRLLIPELSHLDYLLRIDGETFSLSPSEIIEKLREVTEVQYAAQINLNKIKSKENLLIY